MALAATACSSGNEAAAPEAVTPDEARELQQAEEMLEVPRSESDTGTEAPTPNTAE